MHVLSWLPPREVLAVASLVSRRWYHLARDELLWHLICIRQGRCPASAPPACKPESWLTFYFMPQNLLSNTGAEQGIGEGQGWQLKSGGDSWAVGQLDDDTTVEQLGGCQRFFISSYSWCTKRQTVSLVEKGLSAAFLDSSPPIRASEWFCARTDCGSVYHLTVKLLDGEGAVLAKWTTGTKEAKTHWTQEEHVFRNYPPGVRAVSFKTKGKDSKFWAGHYGARMTGAVLAIAWA